MTKIEVTPTQFESLRNDLQKLRMRYRIWSEETTLKHGECRFQLDGTSEDLLCYTMLTNGEPYNTSHPDLLGRFRLRGDEVVFYPVPKRARPYHDLAVKELNDLINPSDRIPGGDMNDKQKLDRIKKIALDR